MNTYLVTVALTAVIEVEAENEAAARLAVPPVNSTTFVYDAEYIGYEVESVRLLEDDDDPQWAAYLTLDYTDKGRVIELEWDAGDDDDVDEDVDADGEYETEEDLCEEPDWDDDDDDDDFDYGEDD